ncbi:MAG: hypothetical protein PF442_01630 [Desulfobulbaceae bacterium]|jgi:predicted RND superfamily exporter protein|nr:hypothetical protein [Desulfobulbaceae bacterium]
MTRIASAFRSHPQWIFILMLLLATIGGYGASKSQVDNSLQVWQSEDDPGWLAYQDFLEQTKLTDPLVILIPAEVDPFALEEISDQLANLPFVNRCQNVHIQTTSNTTGVLFTLTPVTDAEPSQLAEILRQIPTILQGQDITTFHLGGVWYLTHQLDTLSAKATTVLFPVVLLVVSVVIFCLCRQQALLILACGLIPSLLLVGIMGLCGVKMNMVLLALPPLTLILGLAHAIHFTIKVWDADDTPVTIFCRVAPPCALSALTTTMGFGSLLLSSYQPVRQLGLWGGAGSLLSLAVTVILVPTFLQRNTRPMKFSLPADFSQRLKTHRTKILITLGLTLILALLGIARLQTGSLILEFFGPDSVVRTNYTAIEEKGIGLTPMEINLLDHQFSKPELEEPFRQLAALHPEISHFIFTMTDESQQVMSFGATFQVPNLPMAPLTVSRVTLLMHTIPSEATLVLAAEVDGFLQRHLGKSRLPYITGSIPLYTRGQHELFRSMLQSFSLAFLTISLLIGLLLRSLKMAFIAIIPNILPVVLVIAVMGWLTIPLSVATMTVASIIFGIVVDDTIHYLYTYQKQRGLELHQRLNNVFHQVGTPIITTTLITGTGFLAFLASPFIPLAHFGLLISLALWMALCCDLCILPLLLQAIDHD